MTKFSLENELNFLQNFWIEKNLETEIKENFLTIDIAIKSEDVKSLLNDCRQ